MQTSTMHNRATSTPTFWINWLTYTAEFTVLFGLLMVLAPGLTQQAFGLLIFQNTEQFAAFDPQATAYIELAHAVMGSVLVGWGALIFMLVRKLNIGDAKQTCNMIAISVLLWYVPDTAFSLYSGFWQNAVLNSGFAVLYAIPLMALRKYYK
ncbi:hypothetical protein [Limnobacter sp.]|uniref:hypothetical protein n=1 Tax=Limnobacter sp. TaxID=2003368 RepID=UPI002733DEC3|nr:hypothetical protein [Limnobacter sp.]MDP3270600.1 hypothetical protein [Limnobacter sp.]